MSKLPLRAKQLDAYKAMPIYRAEEIPEAADVAAINRAVPQMPTGMEKEEETVSRVCRKISPWIPPPSWIAWRALTMTHIEKSNISQ